VDCLSEAVLDHQCKRTILLLQDSTHQCFILRSHLIGPDPETTPFVLDVLARRSIRTTFFVVGNKLSTFEGRELARRAHGEGHWIGNHTWSHSVPLGLLEDPSAIGEEIRDTQEAIGALAHPHRFFRPVIRR
jgi:peptidoglycan/xylan/chitin deacetylase (PgdA/CDA1 family)